MAAKRSSSGHPVFVVDGARTPFLRLRERPGPLSAADLAVAAGRPLLARQPFEPTVLDEVVVGQALAAGSGATLARSIALRLDCGHDVPAFSVQRDGGSGLQALDTAAQQIACGRADLILAGGADAASHAPLVLPEGMAEFVTQWRSTPSLAERLRLLLDFRPQFLRPVDSLAPRAADPVYGLNLGEAAEELAEQFGIERRRMDAFAVQSHRRAASEQARGQPAEVESVFSTDGRLYDADDGVDPDLSPAGLERLPPLFDRPFGRLSAGNTARPCDGAAWLLLASEQAVRRYQLPILGRLLETQWCGLEPRLMGLGGIHAAAPILKRRRWGLNDIDYWEIEENSAAQLLACLEALHSPSYCRERLGKREAFGELDLARVNIDGGSIALGNAGGASGVRLVLHLLHVLNAHNARRGIAALPVEGGQGGAILVEGRQAQ